MNSSVTKLCRKLGVSVPASLFTPVFPCLLSISCGSFARMASARCGRRGFTVTSKFSVTVVAEVTHLFVSSPASALRT